MFGTRNLVVGGVALFLILVIVVGVAQPGKRLASSPLAETSDPVLESTIDVFAPLTSASPLVVSVPLPSPMREKLALLASDDDRTKLRVHLIISVAELKAATDFGVRIFLNNPAANANTSTKDSHYFRSFAFQPNTLERTNTNAPGNYTFDMTSAITHLWRSNDAGDHKSLTITFVTVGLNSQAQKESVTIPVRQIRLLILDGDQEKGGK
jgi:hypothetical protein